MKSNRRSFLKKISVTSVTASVLPATILNEEAKAEGVDSSGDKSVLKTKAQRDYNGVYKDDFLNRIAFPIGGIGAGMFCLEGTGAISHMSIRHKPDVFNEPGLFAAIHVKGVPNGSKIVEGPVPDWKKFGQAGAGNGSAGAITGLPHFSKAVFKARFPFATIDLSDSDVPLNVQITGWSPFIPTDENNSSLPVGALEYTFV